jgi:hypothetical protein
MCIHRVATYKAQIGLMTDDEDDGGVSWFVSRLLLQKIELVTIICSYGTLPGCTSSWERRVFLINFQLLS